MKKKISLIIILLLLLSCKNVYRAVNNPKIIEFKNKQEYVDYFNSKYGFEKEKIYFLDKREIGDFFRYISNEKISFFYGITLNDSVKIDDPYLNENKSCIGRISNIIDSHNNDYKTKHSELSKYSFKNVNDNPLEISKGKSVVFIISTQLGRAINNDIKKLSKRVDVLNNPNINYYLLTVDSQYIEN